MQRDPTLVTVGGVPWVSRALSGAGATGIRISRLEPDFTTESAAPAPGGGEQFSVSARTYGIPLSDRDSSTGRRSSPQTTPVAAPVGSETATVTQGVGTLRANTTYEYRAFALAGVPAPLAVRRHPDLADQLLRNGRLLGLGHTAARHRTRSRWPPCCASSLSREPASAPLPAGPARARPSARATGRWSATASTARASVTFSVTQRQAGRRGAHGRCVKPTARNRQARRCTRTVTLRGSFAQAGKAGANKFRFTGRLSPQEPEAGPLPADARPRAAG